MINNFFNIYIYNLFNLYLYFIIKPKEEWESKGHVDEARCIYKWEQQQIKPE